MVDINQTLVWGMSTSQCKYMEEGQYLGSTRVCRITTS